MSLQKKLSNAAAEAATHAVQTERGRCLWLLSCMVKATEEMVDTKPMETIQRNYAAGQMAMVKAIVGQVKRGIVSGLRPPTPLSILRQPVNDVGEMQTRISRLIDLLNRLGYGENVTIEEVEAQIVKWEAQEDEIDELRDKIECMQDEISELHEEADHR